MTDIDALREALRRVGVLVRPAALRVTVPPALIVGATLTGIQHLAGGAAPAWTLTALTFAVPWFNASYGFLRGRTADPAPVASAGGRP
jgi:hypothetical protein